MLLIVSVRKIHVNGVRTSHLRLKKNLILDDVFVLVP